MIASTLPLCLVSGCYEKISRRAVAARPTKQHESKSVAAAQALQSSPQDAGLLTARALVHLKLSNWLEAADDATKAISLNPTSSKAHFRKG